MLSSSLMMKKSNRAERLQLYAFWTGFSSTLISLVHVLVVALKK